MPIRVQNDLPVREILEKENIFVMDEHRATHQDIRPIKIGLLWLICHLYKLQMWLPSQSDHKCPSKKTFVHQYFKTIVVLKVAHTLTVL